MGNILISYTEISFCEQSVSYELQAIFLLSESIWSCTRFLKLQNKWHEFATIRGAICREKVFSIFLVCLAKGVLSLRVIHKAVPSRSSRPEVFCKRGVLKNFPNFQENTFIGVPLSGLGPATLLNRDCNKGVFLQNFQNFEEHLFLIEHFRWPLRIILARVCGNTRRWLTKWLFQDRTSFQETYDYFML